MILENLIGLWALTAIIAVLILHRLRQRPESLQVSSLIIWKKIERLLTIAPVRKKSRLYLILMLQILAVIALSLALARPIWRATRPEPLHLVFLIDNSASMSTLYFENQTEDVRVSIGSRWLVMKDKIKEVIAKSPADTTVSFYQAPLLASFIRLRRDEMLNVLDNLKLMEIPSDVESLVSLARGVKGEFYFCSDKLPPQAVLDKLPEKPHLLLLGQPVDNRAIVRASATPTLGKADYYDIFVALKHYSSRTPNLIKISLAALLNDNTEMNLGRQEIEVGADAKKEIFFRGIHLLEKPTLKMSIHPEYFDDLACDNQVTLLPPQFCKINMLGKDNPALVKALKAIPSVSLNSSFLTSDISIFNETLPLTLPAKAIIINSSTESKAFWDYQGRLERPLVSAIDTSSPILKYCDPAVFNNIPYAQKLLPKEKEYIRPIITANSASGDECVLIGEWRKADQHLVFLNFPLEWRGQANPTDWTLTPTFPIFWTNLLNYLHPVSHDYTLGEGLCNEAESDNNGITVLDTALPGQAEVETSRVELGHWSIIGAGLLFLLGWLLAKR